MSAGADNEPLTVNPIPGVSITFADVNSVPPNGGTNVVQTTDAPPLPGDFQLVGGFFYEVFTNANVDGPITVCFPTGGLSAPEILHFKSTPAPGAWVPVQTNVVNDQACGQVDSLSPFAVGTSQIYDVSWPFAPVDTDKVNTMKAGRTVPVKFSLGGDYGVDVFADGYPKSWQVPCDGGDPTDPVETTTTNATGLIYDATSGIYTYNWKTASGWRGTCRTLILQFSDGQERQADFKFN